MFKLFKKRSKRLEPVEYFNELKSNICTIDEDTVLSNAEFIDTKLQSLEKLGQKNVLDKLKFMKDIIKNELSLIDLGYNRFINKSDVVKYIDNVKPLNSVKLVELKNYPRVIPDVVADNIIKAKELKNEDGELIFDTIIIVYTDFTNEEVMTEKQKKAVDRNKDPIVFGMFISNELNIKHERLYFIDDWEDEYCHLTFDKLVLELGKKKKSETTLIRDDSFFNNMLTDDKMKNEDE